MDLSLRRRRRWREAPTGHAHAADTACEAVSAQVKAVGRRCPPARPHPRAAWGASAPARAGRPDRGRATPDRRARPRAGAARARSPPSCPACARVEPAPADERPPGRTGQRSPGPDRSAIERASVMTPVPTVNPTVATPQAAAAPALHAARRRPEERTAIVVSRAAMPAVVPVARYIRRASARLCASRSLVGGCQAQRPVATAARTASQATLPVLVPLGL